MKHPFWNTLLFLAVAVILLMGTSYDSSLLGYAIEKSVLAVGAVALIGLKRVWYPRHPMIWIFHLLIASIGINFLLTLSVVSYMVFTRGSADDYLAIGFPLLILILGICLAVVKAGIGAWKNFYAENKL